MAFDVDSFKQVFVAKDVAVATATKISDLIDGQMVLSDAGGTVLTYAMLDTTAECKTYKELYVTVKKNGNIYRSYPIKYNNLASAISKPYAAKEEKVVYVGYNAGTGSATNCLQTDGGSTVTAATTYQLTVRRKEQNGVYSKFFWSKNAHYYSGSGSAKGYDLAVGLFESAALEFSGKIDGYVRAELVCSVNGAATGSATASVTEGSNVVTLSASGQATFVAGDLVKIDTAQAGSISATSATYVVKSFTDPYITLTTPVSFASTSTTLSTLACNKVTYGTSSGQAIANTGTLAYYGIRLTTVPKKYSAGRFDYDIFDFDTWTSPTFTVAPITVSTKPSRGCGTYQEVCDMEYQAQHSQQYGTANNIVPYNAIPVNATSGLNYNLATLIVKQESEMFAVGDVKVKEQLVLAFTDTSNGKDQAVHTTGVCGVINGLRLWAAAWGVSENLTESHFNA